MKELNIDLNKCEELALNRSKWISYLQAVLKLDKKKITVLDNKRKLQKETVQSANLVVA